MKDMIGESDSLTLTTAALAEVEFTIRWHCADAAHEEHFLARKVNPYRDFLPPGLDQALKDAVAGDSFRETYAPGKLVHGQRPRKIAIIPLDSFKKIKLQGEPFQPHPGRFYPYRILNAHPGIRTTDTRPAFRVLDINDSSVTVDFNHPLANCELDVTARIVRVFSKAGLGRSKLADWVADICEDGPGMQARAQNQHTDFGKLQDDTRPQTTPHLDATAQRHLDTAVEALRVPDCRILDLNELDASAPLPHGDNTIDLALCKLSFNTLADPAAVCAEVHRTLRPGGTFAIALTTPWTPETTSTPWTDLHPFERTGYALQHLTQSGFSNCSTRSYRNWMRPKNDPLFDLTWDSDHLFIITGTKA